MRTLASDAAFDMLMYVMIIPRAVFEILKRLLGCGFVLDTTDRVHDTTSYSTRESTEQNSRNWFL